MWIDVAKENVIPIKKNSTAYHCLVDFLLHRFVIVF